MGRRVASALPAGLVGVRRPYSRHGLPCSARASRPRVASRATIPQPDGRGLAPQRAPVERPPVDLGPHQQVASRNGDSRAGTEMVGSGHLPQPRGGERVHGGQLCRVHDQVSNPTPGLAPGRHVAAAASRRGLPAAARPPRGRCAPALWRANGQPRQLTQRGANDAPEDPKHRGGGRSRSGTLSATISTCAPGRARCSAAPPGSAVPLGDQLVNRPPQRLGHRGGFHEPHAKGPAPADTGVVAVRPGIHLRQPCRRMAGTQPGSFLNRSAEQSRDGNIDAHPLWEGRSVQDSA